MMGNLPRQALFVYHDLLSTIHGPPSTNGQKMADRKIPSGKTISEKTSLFSGKRAFAFAALTKTLEISLVMFWKKSPTREKHRENGFFRHPPFSAAAKKVGQVS
jgi:hypothetical protein